MGICSGKSKQQLQGNSNSDNKAKTLNTEQNKSNPQKQNTLPENLIIVQQPQQQQSNAQVPTQPQTFISQQPDVNDEDDIMKSIIQQFDELNTLFTEMQKEFEQISQYLLRDEDQNQTQ